MKNKLETHYPNDLKLLPKHFAKKVECYFYSN